MDIDNPFDNKLELLGNRMPTDTRDALVYVVDTLDVCIAAAEALFKEKATPEHALAIYDRAMQAQVQGSALREDLSED